MSTQAAIQQTRDEFNRLRGHLFETVESFGLPVKQEDAAKGVIRRTSYASQAAIEGVLREDAMLRNGTRT